MRIITWNVNGIRACIKKGFEAWLEYTKPDILCLQEVRAFQEQVTPFAKHIKGAQQIWNSATKPGYSGVMTLYQQGELYTYNLNLGKDDFDQEGRLIELDCGDFLLYNIYFPNGGRDLKRVNFKLSFYEKLLKRAKKQIKDGRDVIIAGDFNTCHQEIDLARPKANMKNTGFLPEERAWVQKFMDSGFTDSFRHLYPSRESIYSWWSQRGGAREKNVGWRLDYFLVSSGLLDRIQDTVYHSNTLGSDHCPVELILK